MSCVSLCLRTQRALKIDETAFFHGLDPEDVVELEGLGHAPMLGEGAEAVAQVMHEWLDPRY